MTHIIAGQLEPIDVDGVVRTLGLTASYPFVVKPDVKVSGSIGIRAKQSDHFFSGVNLVSTRLYTASLRRQCPGLAERRSCGGFKGT